MKRIALAILVTAGIVTAQGTVIGTFSSPALGTPAGLSHDGAGNLLFTGVGRIGYDEIGIHDTNGALVSNSTSMIQSGNPNGITTDGTFIYVADTLSVTGAGDIDVYDLTYSYIRSFPVATTFPEGIAYRQANGHLYVIDGNASSAFEYDLVGNLISTYPINGSSVDGMAWSPMTDTFWVYDSGTDTIRHYAPNLIEVSSFPGTNAAGMGYGQGVAFVNGLLYVCVPTSRQIVVFDALGSAAQNTSYGHGCPQPATFYELFSGGNFDLANTAIQLRPNAAGGWSVSPSNDTWDPNFANNLGMGDDQLLAGQALGFSINVPGVGSTPTVDIDSNGRLGWGLSGSDFNETVGEFIAQNLLAVFWDDLNPSAAGAGAIYFDQTPNYTMVTWDGVAEYSNSGANSCQVKFYPSGSISIIYGNCSVADCITGFSDASGFDPGVIDISLAMPFHGGAALPLGLSAAARPVINTTLSMNVSGVPGTAVGGAVICGISQVGLDLGSIGATGCSLYSSGDQFSIGYSPGSPSVGMPIPNNTSLNGLSLYWQAVAIDPPANALGVITSNGLETRIGPF